VPEENPIWAKWRAKKLPSKHGLEIGIIGLRDHNNGRLMF